MPLTPSAHPGPRAPLKADSWTVGWSTCRGCRTTFSEPQSTIRFQLSTTGQHPCPLSTKSQPDVPGDNRGFLPSAGAHPLVGVPACVRVRWAARSPSRPDFIPRPSAEEAGRELTSCRPQARSRLNSVISLQSKLGGCLSKGEWWWLVLATNDTFRTTQPAR